MKKSIIIVIIEFASSSGLGTFLLFLFSLIFLLGGILTGFDWFVSLFPTYFNFPNILFLFSLFAVIYFISYFSFLKSPPFFTVMSNISLLTTILILIGNRLLGLFFGTKGMRPYFLENALLFLGYIFCCTFIGIVFSAFICFISRVVANKRIKSL